VSETAMAMCVFAVTGLVLILDARATPSKAKGLVLAGISGAMWALAAMTAVALAIT